MINVNEIIRARETGSYYIGDINRDIDDVLNDVGAIHERENAAKANQGEILAQLPEEDFLQDVIDELTDCVTEKMNKSEIIDRVKKALTMLEDIQQCQVSSTEYAYSLKI